MQDNPFEKAPNPTEKQRGLYKQWKKYLSDSKLSEDEVRKRASEFALANKKVPKE